MAFGSGKAMSAPKFITEVVQTVCHTENIPVQWKAVFQFLTIFGRQKMVVAGEEQRI